jgi:hypothetical protein
MGIAVMSLIIISGLLFYYLSPAIPKFVDEAFYRDKPILNASVISQIPNAKIIVTEEEWFSVVSYDSTSLVFYRFTDKLTLDSQILSNLDISIEEDEDTFVMNNGYLYWYHPHEAHGVLFRLDFSRGEITEIASIAFPTSFRYRLNSIAFDGEFVLCSYVTESHHKSTTNESTAWVLFASIDLTTLSIEVLERPGYGSDISLAMYRYTFHQGYFYGVKYFDACDLVRVDMTEAFTSYSRSEECPFSGSVLYSMNDQLLQVNLMKNDSGSILMIDEIASDFSRLTLTLDSNYPVSQSVSFDNGVYYSAKRQGIPLHDQYGQTFFSIVYLDESNQLKYYMTEVVDTLTSLHYFSGRFISINVRTGEIVSFTID